MTSEPISKIFPSPEKLSPILTSNSMTTPTKAKENTSNPPKEKDEDLPLSKGSDILNSPSFSKYINPQRLKPYEDILKKNIRSFSLTPVDDKNNEQNIEKNSIEKNKLDSPTIEINFKFTCDYELIESELKDFLELFGEINSLNYDMNANSLKINYKYYFSAMYVNYYLNQLIYENKRKNKYDKYLILTGKEGDNKVNIDPKKISGLNEKQSEDIFKFIKFLTENYKNEPKLKLHETPVKSVDRKSVNKSSESNVKDKEECQNKDKDAINPERKVCSSNINDAKNLFLQQNSETPVKKENVFKNYSANNIISNDKTVKNNKSNSNASAIPLNPFNSALKPPFLFMPLAPKMNMKFGIPIPVIFPVSPFLPKPFQIKKTNKENKNVQKMPPSIELKHEENKINSSIIDNNKSNNPINLINDKIENDNIQSQNDKQIKEIFDNINNKIANISNNSNDSTNSNEKNNNISNYVNVDSINKSNSDSGSINKNMSNKSDSTIKTEKVNKSNNNTTEELRRIIDIKNLEDLNINKSFNSKEGNNKSNSSSERNSDFMSSLKGKTLSLERLNNFLQANKPVSNFENPVISLNQDLNSDKDSKAISKKAEEENQNTKNSKANDSTKKESLSFTKNNNQNKDSFQKNNPMNNFFNPMYNLAYIPIAVPDESFQKQKNLKKDYPLPPFPYVPPLPPFPNFMYQNNPMNFNKDVIDFNKLTLETKNKVHFMTHSSRNYCYKYVCNYTVQIENDNLFMVTKRIIGKNGCFLKKILQEACIKYGDYSTKIRLRGKGSGYVDKVNSECNEEPLMLSVSSLNYPTYYNCCLLLDNLMNKIYDDYYEHLHQILPKELHYSIIKKKLIKNEFVVNRVNSMPFNNFNKNINPDEFSHSPKSKRNVDDNKSVENKDIDSK